MAYRFLITILLYIVIAIIFGVMIGLVGINPSNSAMTYTLIPFYIIGFIAMFIFAKRRLNDLNQTGWLGILLIIPVVNFLIALYFTFFPVFKSSNRFGAKPSENTVLIWIGGLALPIIAIVGVIAAIALPAYADFANQAVQLSTGG